MKAHGTRGADASTSCAGPQACFPVLQAVTSANEILAGVEPAGISIWSTLTAPGRGPCGGRASMTSVIDLRPLPVSPPGRRPLPPHGGRPRRVRSRIEVIADSVSSRGAQPRGRTRACVRAPSSLSSTGSKWWIATRDFDVAVPLHVIAAVGKGRLCRPDSRRYERAGAANRETTEARAGTRMRRDRRSTGAGTSSS